MKFLRRCQPCAGAMEERDQVRLHAREMQVRGFGDGWSIAWNMAHAGRRIDAGGEGSYCWRWRCKGGCGRRGQTAEHTPTTGARQACQPQLRTTLAADPSAPCLTHTHNAFLFESTTAQRSPRQSAALQNCGDGMGRRRERLLLDRNARTHDGLMFRHALFGGFCIANRGICQH
jgi:hypothetical protein